MQLRQGCLQRAPWCRWLILAVATVALLPKAAIVVGNRESAGNDNLASPRAGFLPSKRIGVLQFQAKDRSAGQQPLLTKTYEVADLVARLVSERGETSLAAREHLAAIVQCCAPGLRDINSRVEVKPEIAGMGSDFERIFQLNDNSAERSMSWFEDSLVVRQTETGHGGIESQLAALRRHGFSELNVEVRILSGPVLAIDQVSTKWKLIGSTPNDERVTEVFLENDNGDQVPEVRTEQIRSTVESLIEKQIPALVAFLDREETRRIVVSAQDGAMTSILSAPKVVVLNGQAAQILDTTQRPFVVGVKPTPNGGVEPQFRNVSEGTSIRLRPELQSEDRITLELGLALSHIRAVETVKFPLGGGADPVTVQIPEVSMLKLNSTIDMNLDQTLAISLPSMPSPRASNGGCILVNVSRLPPKLRGEVENSVARTAQTK